GDAVHVAVGRRRIAVAVSGWIAVSVAAWIAVSVSVSARIAVSVSVPVAARVAVSVSVAARIAVSVAARIAVSVSARIAVAFGLRFGAFHVVAVAVTGAGAVAVAVADCIISTIVAVAATKAQHQAGRQSRDQISRAQGGSLEFTHADVTAKPILRPARLGRGRISSRPRRHQREAQDAMISGIQPFSSSGSPKSSIQSPLGLRTPTAFNSVLNSLLCEVIEPSSTYWPVCKNPPQLPAITNGTLL